MLLLKTNTTLPPGLFQKSDLYSRKHWCQVQYLANLFWSRWTREYLPILQVKKKWRTKSRNLSREILS